MPGAIESSLGFATELKTASLANHRVRLFLWYPFDPLLPYGGNKVFKLQPNLALARQAGYQRVATFGGAFSNHLLALAHAASGSGLQLVCFVRGDPQLTPSATLRDLVDLGAQLQFLSRQDYRLRQNPQFLNSLKEQFPECYWIPEGGSNLAGVRGCAQMGRLISQWATSHIDGPYRVVLPAATGGTLAGLRAGLEERASVTGVAVLKQADFIARDVTHWLDQLGCRNAAWFIEQRFHGGGYAKCSDALHDFVLDCYQHHRVLVEPVYSGKMLYAIRQMLEAGELDGQTVVAVHTGGLQGLRGRPELLADLAQVGFQGLQ